MEEIFILIGLFVSVLLAVGIYDYCKRKKETKKSKK
jgi:hypothetical protein